MLLVALGAGALLAGVPVLVVAGALAASVLPTPGIIVAVLALVAVSVVGSRIGRTIAATSEGVLLRQIAGRVSAGSTIRSTIADPAIAAVPVSARRLATLGMPMADVGGALMNVFPVNGQAFRAICSFSEHTGATISSALVVLADRADEATELARQRRVSLAQARFSAIVVGIVPIVLSAALIGIRGVPEPGGAVIVVPMVVGFVLQAAGTFIVFKVASGAN